MIKSSKFDDLKKIYVLKTLVEQKSLNKTAQVHKVTPSAVSQTIKALELSLGYPVITKHEDSWRPTEKGLILIEQMEKVFETMSGLIEADSQEELNIGSLSIGTHESIALDVVKNLNNRIRLDFPNVKLIFQIDRSANLIKKIQSGELCLSVIAQSDCTPDSFLKETLFEDTLGLYVSSLSEVNSNVDIKENIIGMISGQSEGVSRYLKKFLEQIPEFRPNFLCDSFEVLRNLAEESSAVVVLPHRVAIKSGTKLKKIKINGQTFDGNHQIQLIASGTCDRKEFEYVLDLLKNTF